ncbi:MAG: response regulator [Candidatus Lernaella stagnicola]|nr:response regulator [Candidatus Lernaella stagnicola]
MRNQRIIMAAVVIALVVAAHVLYYQYVSSQVTELAWDHVNNLDRARMLRLVMQIPLLIDLAMICGLIAWVAVRSQEIKELDTLRDRHTSLRRTLEKDRRISDTESRVQNMFENSPHLMMLFDEEGRLLLANRMAIDIFLLDRKPLSDVVLTDLLSDGPIEKFEDLREALQTQGAQRMQVTFQRADHERFTSEVEIVAFDGSKGEQLISLTIESPPVKKTPSRSSTDRPFVLVADDEKLVRLMMESMVDRLGYQPLSATTGREAVEQFRAYSDRIVAVVLDQVMPDVDGITASEEIRRLAPDVPILFCSGYADLPSDAPSDQKARLIRKPFSFEDFSLALTAALEQKTRT